MKSILSSARRLRLLTRNDILNKYPALTPSLPIRRDPGAMILGRDQDGNVLSLSLRARLEHSHYIGTTGGGKTKLIEHNVRQDIIAGRGVCVVDPHGNHPDSLYRSLLSWLDERGFTTSRTIHLIDPNVPSHVTGINPLALPSPEYQPTVIAEAMQEALEKVWGEEDMNTKPTMQRVLSALLTAVTELDLTLAEADLFLEPEDDIGIRSWAIANLSNEHARKEIKWLHEMALEPRGRTDFVQEVTGPRNRLSKIIRDDAVKYIVGQKIRTIDFQTALDQGHIILANLSPGPYAGDKATQMIGRVLTRLLFFNCVRRQHPERPFFVYLDECQLYLSGDISRALAEARKFGVGMILSHQYLGQFDKASLPILEAIKNACNIKVVLRIKAADEAAELADMVMNYDLEMPIRSLVKPTIVGQRRILLYGESDSEQFSTTDMRSDTVGYSRTESSSHTSSESATSSETFGATEGESRGSAEGESSASMSSEGRGSSLSTQFVPAADGSLISIVVGTAEGASTHESTARSSGVQSTRSRGSNRASSHQVSRGLTTSDAWTEGVAHTTSESTSTGRAISRAQGKSRGWRESLEPILEDRPTANHSLENVRYMAAAALRQLMAGHAAIGFVDASGMKTAALRVANVESYALPPQEFAELQRRVLETSSSAIPIDEARKVLSDRLRDLQEAAAKLHVTEPETSAGFRTRRKRPLVVEPTVDLHGERSAPERAPVKGLDRQRRRP